MRHRGQSRGAAGLGFRGDGAVGVEGAVDGAEVAGEGEVGACGGVGVEGGGEGEGEGGWGWGVSRGGRGHVYFCARGVGREGWFCDGGFTGVEFGDLDRGRCWWGWVCGCGGVGCFGGRGCLRCGWCE